MSAARLPVAGFLLALGSAASFALSGVFASALIGAGWSAGAAATARIVVATLVLAAPTAIALRGRWDLVRRAWRSILLFGLLAVAGCQLAFFLAVEFIPPSLALLIEFMGPVLLMLWMWLRTRIAPTRVTLLGAAIAVVGLVAVSGVGLGAALHPLGIAFALIAAIGNAAYYAAGAASDHGIPPLPFVGLGLAVAAVALVIASAVGLLPFTATAVAPVIADAELSPIAVVAGMALISTVLAYVLGVSASRRLGATVASFTGYSEPLFGILWTILLLALVPSGSQWIGAALIVAGVVTVRIGELRGARTRLRGAPGVRETSRSGETEPNLSD
ncbi:DMT family transporter [Leucobacter triazinivorans]|uniref:DMT family transporter n=1 Tax=Leucobacter triazinivorans TaxID=1784719 RepID=A0A4P6KKF7_9MICO|nr:DMT family transporter [Leucobacter triazinivorans]